MTVGRHRYWVSSAGWAPSLPSISCVDLPRLAELTDAKRDQDHIRVVMYGDSTIPDRSDAFEHGGEDPLPQLLAGVRFLNNSGVAAIAVPCNSAHLWYEQMQAASTRPIIHIVDSVIDELRALPAHPVDIGVLATEATLRSGLYGQRLKGAGFRVVAHSEELVAESMASIRAVKRGDLAEGRALARSAARRLVTAGAQALVVGCTDLSVVIGHRAQLEHVPLVDANTALALACIARLG